MLNLLSRNTTLTLRSVSALSYDDVPLSRSPPLDVQSMLDSKFQTSICVQGTEFGEREYVKVLTVNSQISCIMTFCVTLEAKDLADGAKVKTYQTKVLMRPPRGPNP